MSVTGHIDTFTADNLPPRSAWPVFELEGFDYPAQLNCAQALLESALAAGRGARVAIESPTERWTYAALSEVVDRLAWALTKTLGLVPGNRVLLRGPNTPMMAAAWLAVVKAGGVAVATMPLLRERELAQIVHKARITHALCDARLVEAVEAVRGPEVPLQVVATFGDATRSDAVEAAMAQAPGTFEACPTSAEDTCIIAFTSGTTGEPKGTMHFHRDVLAICDAFPASCLGATPDDRFIGSPPLAFTFGLGGLLLFPMRIGATAVLIERVSPELLLEAIARHRATVCVTSPTAYRAMAAKVSGVDLTSLRKCVSAGEALPSGTRTLWREATGIEIIDGIGSTELLHIFISHTEGDARPGATGKAIPGYRACVLDEAGEPLPRGQVGRLAVRGPTGCRYLADARQSAYVVGGWNLTGDAYLQDEDGYFHFQARTDDMIISAGYNIAGPEVEAALLLHPSVAECAVVGWPDDERGQIVKAFVVLRPEVNADDRHAAALQAFVKASIAPYKYPRAVEFVQSLPRTETGKLQRFKLRGG